MNTVNQSEQQVKREKILKGVISAYIILQVSLTFAFLSPDTIALRQAITDAASGVWKFCGLWQGWNLFAPEIRNVNSHSVAVIQFDDGSSTIWPLQRMDQMNPIDKFRRDKFRKWTGDNVQWDRYREYWPAFARYVGRLHYDGTGPKPVSLALIIFKSNIDGPETHVKRADMPPHTEAGCSFFYTYKPEDLRQ